jgi:hypothetical protein
MWYMQTSHPEAVHVSLLQPYDNSILNIVQDTGMRSQLLWALPSLVVVLQVGNASARDPIPILV